RQLLERTGSQSAGSENSDAARANIGSDAARANAEFLAKLMNRSPKSNPPRIPDPPLMQAAAEVESPDKGASNREQAAGGKSDLRTEDPLPKFMKRRSVHVARVSSGGEAADTSNEGRRGEGTTPASSSEPSNGEFSVGEGMPVQSDGVKPVRPHF